MNLSEFEQKIPKDKSVDIRPHVASQVRHFIRKNKVQTASNDYSPAANVIRKVCRDTGFVDRRTNRSDAGKRLSNSEKESDYYTNVVNAWAGADKSRRGKPELARATFYWFFRYVPDPSYFVEIARNTWKTDSELFKRFCYAKEGGHPDDSFETIVDRFRSDEALNYRPILGDRQEKLPVSFPRAFDLGSAYQSGREEFRLAKRTLLAKGSISVALTTAVFGAGGYGKSSIAQELCDDRDIRKKFSGGIYWLQFGQINSNDESAGSVRLSEAIDRMLVSQYPKAQRPSLVWDNSDRDIRTLLETLPESPLLIVADDLWNDSQANWLSEVPGYVSVLTTTRVQSVAARSANQIPIKRLTDEAAYALLTHGMEKLSAAQEEQFRKLVPGFKGWPLLLNLANGVFKRMNGGSMNRIDRAINEYEQFLNDGQLDGWDVEKTGEEELAKRRKLVGHCIEASVNAIHPSNKPEFLRTFAVFPDDADIPFSVAIDLWNQIGGEKIGRTKGLTRLRHFNDFSLFSMFDEDAETFRLHDEILAYFRGALSDKQLGDLHRKLVASIKKHCGGNWDTLNPNHRYGWTRLLYHLENAGLATEADDLRTEYRWIKAKLAAVGASELRRSFVPIPRRADARDTGRAINLSVSLLANRPRALGHQLFGRLGHETDVRLKKLVQAAHSDSDCWPFPAKPHLSPLGPELLRLVGHSGAVRSAAFDPSGRRIVSASDDHSIRLWDAETGTQVGRPLKGHRAAVVCAAFDSHGRRIVSASDDHSIRLWDAETGTQIGRPLEGHRAAVLSAVFDRSGRRIVTTSYDGTVRLWDAETGAQLRKPLMLLLVGYENWANSAAFDPSGRRIVTASNDGLARLWDTEIGAPIGIRFEGHMGEVSSAVFDISGRKLLTASYDDTARLWDTETGAPIGGPLEGHRDYVASAAFDPSGRRIVTASHDHTARIWDVETGAQLGKPLEGHDHWVNCAAFDPSGLRIVTASHDQTARIWNAETGVQIGKPLERPDYGVECAAFDSSGRRIVSASRDWTARIWDAETGVQLGKPLEGHEGGINCAAFDPNGRRIVTTSYDRTARIWDAETGAPIGRPLEGHHDEVVGAAFNPRGRTIVTASHDNTARIWDAETGVQIGKPLEGHDYRVNCASFDPNGCRIVTASHDHTARIWKAETGVQLGKPLEGHDFWVKFATFDPSGRRIVTTSYDGTARIWDAETGAPIGRPLEGHNDVVVSAAFDPSGRMIVTTSHDRTARLWDAETRMCLAVIDFDLAPICAAWPGKRFVVGLRNGAACYFRFDRED